MPLVPWLTLSREKILDCVIFSVLRLRRRSQTSGIERDFYALESRDWVNVVAVTPSEEVVLVRQYRQGSGELSLEVPGGVVDPGESALQTGLRELEEETGYRSARALELCRVRPNPAILENWLTVILALDAEPSGTTCFDESEEIEVELHPIGTIDTLVRGGQVTHAYTALALREYQRELRR